SRCEISGGCSPACRLGGWWLRGRQSPPTGGSDEHFVLPTVPTAPRSSTGFSLPVEEKIANGTRQHLRGFKRDRAAVSVHRDKLRVWNPARDVLREGKGDVLIPRDDERVVGNRRNLIANVKVLERFVEPQHGRPIQLSGALDERADQIAP